MVRRCGPGRLGDVRVAHAELPRIRVIGLTTQKQSASHVSAVAIIGPIASGKSTVSRLLSAGLSWQLVSFGAYIRHVVSGRQISLGRRTELERIGAELICERGHEQFTVDVLGWHGDTEHAVLDGVRHVEVLQVLRRAYEEIFSFYLDVPADVRYERWLCREEREATPDSRAVFEGLANDQVERHVYSLVTEVDHVITCVLEPDAVAAEIRSFVRG